VADPLEPVDQGGSLRAVAGLARRRDQPHRQPESIDGGL
jgi:hypothetical protein